MDHEVIAAGASGGTGLSVVVILQYVDQQWLHTNMPPDVAAALVTTVGFFARWSIQLMRENVHDTGPAAPEHIGPGEQ